MLADIGERTAEASLERALDLAEPDGIVLPFVLVDIREVLERVRPDRTAHSALRRTILDVLAGSAPSPGGRAPCCARSSARPSSACSVTCPPTSARLTSPPSYSSRRNTIWTHLRHIYAKVDAHGRAEAVDRARQL